jgi:hypothetical protein
MIDIEQIKKKAIRHYAEWLKQIALGNEAYQALVINRIGDKPGASTQRHIDLRDLYNAAHPNVANSYRIVLSSPERGSRQQQSVIKSIVFDTAEDLLVFTEKKTEYERFVNNLTQLLSQQPDLQAWCAENVKLIIENDEKWPQLLAIYQFFQDNPTPDLPLRLLPVPGVDTKFFEQNSTVLRSLLDHLLPIVDTSEHRLARRYGLPEQAPLIECAWNDTAIQARFQGFTRLAFPLEQLAQNALSVRRVLIVENHAALQQALTVSLADTIIIFGSGYRVLLLKQCNWLRECSLFYWGDLDTHGLSILGQLRTIFPHLQALMMDEATLNQHLNVTSIDVAWNRVLPSALTDTEQHLFVLLQTRQLRLEQERITSAWIGKTLMGEMG